MKKFRTITIAEAVDTQDYSHDEMENLVFIEKAAVEARDELIEKAISTIQWVTNNCKMTAEQHVKLGDMISELHDEITQFKKESEGGDD